MNTQNKWTRLLWILVFPLLILILGCEPKEKEEEEEANTDSPIAIKEGQSEAEEKLDNNNQNINTDKEKTASPEEIAEALDEFSQVDEEASADLLLLTPRAAFPEGLALAALPDALDVGEPMDPVGADTLLLPLVSFNDIQHREVIDDPPPEMDCAEVMATPHELNPGKNGGNDDQYISCLKKQTYSDTIKQQKALLAGTAEKCFQPRWLQVVSMLDPGIGCFYTGFMTHTLIQPDGRPCSVAYSQDEIMKARTFLESGLNLAAGMLCETKKDAQGPKFLPSKDTKAKTLPLTTYLQKAFTNAEMGTQVSKANVTYLFDIEDRPVYRTDISIKNTQTPMFWICEEREMQGHMNACVKWNKTKYPECDEMDLHIVHVPPFGDKKGYFGTMWASYPQLLNEADIQEGKSACPKRVYMSMRYAQDGQSAGDVKLKAEILSALIETTLEKDYFITDQGALDLNLDVPEANWSMNLKQNQNNWCQVGLYGNSKISGIRLLRFDLNPWSNEGRLAAFYNGGITLQAGSEAEHGCPNDLHSDYLEGPALGMVFELAKNSSGKLAGCAVSGWVGNTPSNVPTVNTLPGSLRRYLKEGSFDLWPDQVKENEHPDVGAEVERVSVYKQCFYQDENGAYQNDSANSPAYIGDPSKHSQQEINDPNMNHPGWPLVPASQLQKIDTTVNIPSFKDDQRVKP